MYTDWGEILPMYYLQQILPNIIHADRSTCGRTAAEKPVLTITEDSCMYSCQLN